jgi:hypothetical protein
MAYTTIDKPTDYFNIKLYTGNATNPTTISGIGFQPDWVWTKGRSTAEGHRLCDSVRGATKDLLSNTKATESTNTIGLKSFNSDGYVIGNSNGYNQNSQTFVSWNWLAGTSFSNDASSTSIGTIDSTGSVNTDAGFSIISYVGNQTSATVAHGLGAAPEMIIFKNRDIDTHDWFVYHQGAGNTNALFLNTTAAVSASASFFGNTTPTSTVFTIAGEFGVNKSSTNIIAYCFAPKQGYSKFGSYTGNNNANGPFIYTGFKPAFVMTKMTNGAKSWQIYDNKRFPLNPINAYLTLNSDTNAAEAYGTVYPIDFLSNGFKFNTDTSEVNGTNNYIYMAFAENPFVTSGGVPVTAK